jgi:hypothetical protein
MWFIGSVIIGKLYDVSMAALILFSVVAQIAAVAFCVTVRRRVSPADLPPGN